MGAESRTVQIDSLDDFDRCTATGTASLRDCFLRDVDLRARDDVLARLDPAGAVFLGCLLSPRTDARLRARGALVFPSIPDVPFDPYRSMLYSPTELFDAMQQAGAGVGAYEQTLDARIHSWHGAATRDHDVRATLATALHDHAVDDALADVLTHGAFAGATVMGVMGGHAVARSDPAYREAMQLGHQLARRGHVVATGGGPGAMEASNAGAYLSRSSDVDLDAALASIAAVPSFRPSVTAWAAAALDVVAAHPDGVPSLGIPTWSYGHEPPNPFATHIAKYFTNSVREAVLLHVCTGGIVFLPGAAGTVQEVFQDACENYYATGKQVAPMVLLGTEYWSRTLPVWPLLQRLAGGRDMAAHVSCVDTVDEALAAVG